MGNDVDSVMMGNSFDNVDTLGFSKIIFICESSFFTVLSIFDLYM